MANQAKSNKPLAVERAVQVIKGTGIERDKWITARVQSPLVRTIVQVQELLEAYAVADEQHGKLTWLTRERVVSELGLSGPDADRARWALFLLTAAVRSNKYREVESRLDGNSEPEYRLRDGIVEVSRG